MRCPVCSRDARNEELDALLVEQPRDALGRTDLDHQFHRPEVENIIVTPIYMISEKATDTILFDVFGEDRLQVFLGGHPGDRVVEPAFLDQGHEERAGL